MRIGSCSRARRWGLVLYLAVNLILCVWAISVAGRCQGDVDGGHNIEHLAADHSLQHCTIMLSARAVWKIVGAFQIWSLEKNAMDCFFFLSLQ
jgi:hypothetical protein